MVVDGVTDVVEIAAADVKPAPALGTPAGDSWVRGLITIAAGMVILLDIEVLVSRGLPATASDDATAGGVIPLSP
jgi:purine-binding chemotaxis protein CheW